MVYFVQSKISVIIFIIILSHQCFSEIDYEFELERIEGIQGTKETITDYSKLKVKRIKRIRYAAGSWEFKVDLNESFTCGVSAEYSPLGNNQFIRHPFRIPKLKECQFHNTTFKKYLQESLIGYTNFPVIPPEGLCPIPKGVYNANNIVLKGTNLPAHISRGLWKLELKHWFGDDLVGGANIFVWIRDKRK